MSDRALLTGGMLLAVALLCLLMLRGWRSRQRRQGQVPAPPEPPYEQGEPLLPAVAGLFVGTTFAGDWLDRVAVHDLGHRAAGWLVVATDGVHVEREGVRDLYLPYAQLESVALGDALAGKVVGRDGMLLLTWRLGDRVVTSGFRADDHDEHRRIVDTITGRLAATITGRLAATDSISSEDSA